MVTIIPERERNAGTIRQVNELAFGRAVEGAIVDRLRRTCAEYL